MEKLEFKRSAIREIRKHPIIWDHVNKGPYSKATDVAWDKVEAVLNFPKDKIRRQWNTIRSHYTEILMTKTIERNTKFPTWVLFHDLSFLYGRIKMKIKEKMGGISPPLLQPRLDQIDPKAEPCPCCEPPAKYPNDTTLCRQPIYTLTLQNLYDTPPPKEALKQALKLKSSQSTVDQPIANNPNASLNPQNGTQRLPVRVVNRSPKRPLEIQDNQDGVSQPVAKQKAQRRFYESTNRERLMVRVKMIECIKAFPVLYTKSPNSGHCRFTHAWQKVATAVGLPAHIVKTRWKVCKQRYVEELAREKNSNGTYRSTWDLFEPMSFMRPHMNSDIEEINRLREEIQQIVKERRNRQTIDLCATDDQDSDQNFEANKQPSPTDNHVNSSPAHISKTSDLPNHAADLIDLFTTENDSQEEGGSLSNAASSPVELVSATASPVAGDLAITLPSDQPYLDIQMREDSQSDSSIEILNLCSDDELEEDDDENTIYLDGNESIASDISVEVYEEEIVYFAEPQEEDVICLDDGDET